MKFYFIFYLIFFLISFVKPQCNNITKCVNIPKCCGLGEVYINRQCNKSLTHSRNFIRYVYKHSDFNLLKAKLNPIPNRSCKNSALIEDFRVQSDGKLLLTDTTEYISSQKFCLEINYTTENDQLLALWCYDEQAVIQDPPQVMNIGMIISMPFLLATFIAYALLPDRNLHMKALMFYVINLFFGYLLLVIVQLSNTQIHDTACSLIGYFALFFFIVSFFWMNVICIDIWFAFSGLRGFSGSKKLAERKRFFIYCGYAWGVPVIHTLVVFGIQSLTRTSSVYNPAIGVGQCFFKRGYPELLYFYGPMAIIITINMIFFAITAIKIRKVKKDTSVLKKEDSKRHSYENDKQTFNLYLKLLFAMGINWSMEIISWAMTWADAAPAYVWYLTDFCNAIYGVFIFFIFVFKKNIWKLLKKRYYSFIGRPHLAHSMASTNATRTTSYSTANSMQEHPHGGGANDTTTLTHETSVA